jgi:hypothetical protein
MNYGLIDRVLKTYELTRLPYGFGANGRGDASS